MIQEFLKTINFFKYSKYLYNYEKYFIKLQFKTLLNQPYYSIKEFVDIYFKKNNTNNNLSNKSTNNLLININTDVENKLSSLIKEYIFYIDYYTLDNSLELINKIESIIKSNRKVFYKYNYLVNLLYSEYNFHLENFSLSKKLLDKAYAQSVNKYGFVSLQSILILLIYSEYSEEISSTYISYYYLKAANRYIDKLTKINKNNYYLIKEDNNIDKQINVLIFKKLIKSIESQFKVIKNINHDSDFFYYEKIGDNTINNTAFVVSELIKNYFNIDFLFYFYMFKTNVNQIPLSKGYYNNILNECKNRNKHIINNFNNINDVNKDFNANILKNNNLINLCKTYNSNFYFNLAVLYCLASTNLLKQQDFESIYYNIIDKILNEFDNEVYILSNVYLILISLHKSTDIIKMKLILNKYIDYISKTFYNEEKDHYLYYNILFDLSKVLSDSNEYKEFVSTCIDKCIIYYKKNNYLYKLSKCYNILSAIVDDNKKKEKYYSYYLKLQIEKLGRQNVALKEENIKLI